MNFDVLISLTSPIDAHRQAARLERTRQVREATAPTLLLSPLRRQVGLLLSQAGAWLHQTVAQLALPGPGTSTDM